MIYIKDLKPENINQKVVYEAYKNAPLEEGRITSWNDTHIFVDYTNVGRGNATPPQKLTFVTQ